MQLGGANVCQLTNSAGAVTDTYEYDAFGNLIASTGSTPNSYLYRGERYDAHLGLYYLRARWYNPATGRFMTRDPYSGSIYDPASLHRYNYARANPANFVDPSGRASMAEYGLLLTNSVVEAVTVTALQYEVNCAIYAEASALQLVNQHMGQDITQFGALFKSCAGEITVQQFARDTMTNLLFMGAGKVIGKGIGWLLESGAQGEMLAARTAGSGMPRALRAGQIAEEGILESLGSAGKVPFTPTQEQIDSAAFKVIVGDAKYTAQGSPVGVVYDGSVGNGVAEVKTGTSVLDSSYQLRLETYGALVNDTPFTIYTSRPINPTFNLWLTNWGVAVLPLPY